MTIHSLDHYTILTRDLEASIAFYCDIIGLRVGDRPAFDFSGAWLYAGEQAVLHLMALHPERPARGRLDHAALKASGYKEMKARLDAAGISYHESDLPGRPIRQLFVTTPEEESLELIFDAAEVS